ncbi:MAG: hypothetical protein LBU06_05035 [Desulfovibrio sp.]|jgi:5-enolpyruvylshikimate-3-phosphate synthase|nr:hypothetical protein [Desulfovibrio sp.]
MSEYKSKPDERGTRRPDGAAAAIIELDRELMKLLARRSVLLSRMREGKEQATGPAAIRAEKSVRIAWEAEAVNFSKDPLFSRQLFNLLQEIKVLRREEAQNAPVFNLNPPRRPISGTLAGPTDGFQARLRLILAACLGQDLELKNVLLTAELLEAVKICSRAGAACTYNGRGTGNVEVRAGKPLELGGRTFFVGDDFFVLCLIMFLALAKPGVLRFNGGSRLKFSDLRVLRGFLPLLGARFYHIVPHSLGLPAGLECSGEIPDEVTPPAELPVEAVCALLAAPVFWQRPFRADLALLPGKTRDAALANVLALYTETGAEFQIKGSLFDYSPGPLVLPRNPVLPLDPVLSAFILAFPAFAGGSITVLGKWPAQTPEAAMAEGLLKFAGLGLECEEGGIVAQAADNSTCLPLTLSDLNAEFGPLFLAICARRLILSDDPSFTKDAALFPRTEDATALAGDFFFRLGLDFQPGLAGKDGEKAEKAVSETEETRFWELRKRITPDRKGGENLTRDSGRRAGSAAWTCPDACWGMAFALAAFTRPGLVLANPGAVTEKNPVFWSIYNSLPDPRIHVPAWEEPREKIGDPNPRRRFKAD